jgi:hypothetical protein
MRFLHRLRFGSRTVAARQRLSSEIRLLADEAEDSSLDPRTSKTVRALLNDAVRSAAQHNINEGYDFLNAAKRASYKKLSTRHERAAVATRIAAEAEAKLSGWRLTTVRDLLDIAANTHRTAKHSGPSARAHAQRTVPPTIMTLQHAQLMLDENSSNVYRRLDVYGRALKFAFAALVVILIAMYFVIRGEWLKLSGTALESTGGYIGVLVLGALGSMLSVALTRLRAPRARLPELFESRLVDWLRPGIGAASAVALVVVIESGIQQAVLAEQRQVYVWALAAGFSERLLRRTLNSLAASAQSPTNR